METLQVHNTAQHTGEDADEDIRRKKKEIYAKYNRIDPVRLQKRQKCAVPDIYTKTYQSISLISNSKQNSILIHNRNKIRSYEVRKEAKL